MNGEGGESREAGEHKPFLDLGDDSYNLVESYFTAGVNTCNGVNHSGDGKEGEDEAEG